jgi:hypothetical protein
MYLNTTLPTTLSSLQFENKLRKEREEELMKRRKIYCPCLHKRRADLFGHFMFLCAYELGGSRLSSQNLEMGNGLKGPAIRLGGSL